MAMINHKEVQKNNIRDLVETLQMTLNYSVSPDIAGITELLTRQALVLDTAFQRLLVIGDKKIESKQKEEGDSFEIYESKYFAALKTQNQCRKTVTELRGIMKEGEKERDKFEKLANKLSGY